MFLLKIGENNIKLCMFKEGANKEETEYNIKHKIIDNQIILVCGYTGSGKSVFANLIAFILKQLGYTVVYITEKESFEFNNAFGVYPITAQYHLNNLKRQGLNQVKDSFRIHHPFSFSINPKEKLFPINWFTFSIQNIHPQGFAIMLTGDSDKQTVRICESVKKQLDGNDNIWTFLDRIYKKIKAQDFELYSQDPEDMGLPIKSIGTEKTLSDIRDGISDLRQHFFVQPDSFKYNLNMVDILNDNKNTHLFSKKWIDDKKTKHFVTLQLLAEIDNAIASGKVRHPVCLILEEIENEFPDSKKTNYEEITCKYAINIMKRIRQKGMVIATAQNYFSTDKDFRRSCNQKFLGKLSMEDKQTLIKDFYHVWKADAMKALGRLNDYNGCFIWWENLEKTGIPSVIQGHLPPFANAEEEENFLEKFREFYPDEMKQNLEIYNEMKEIREAIEKDRKVRLKEMEKSERQREKDKEEAKQKRIQDLEQEISKGKRESKETVVEILGKDAYKKRKIEKLSWGKVGKGTGKNLRTSRKYAFAYAKIIGDDEFINGEMMMLEDSEKDEIRKFIEKSVRKDRIEA